MTILTMLGTTTYQLTRYEWNGKSCETHLFPIAVATWFPHADIKALVTTEAKEKHGNALCNVLPQAELIDIPSGKSEDEFWQIFNQIIEALPENEVVILDITHGFRSLPTLALLTLAFLRTAKNIELKHVLYGAYGTQNTGHDPTPVFDLTPFVKMLDWANATERFLDTGDARKIAPLITEQRRNPLNDVARSMSKVSEALALMRGERITEESRRLITNVEQAKEEEWEAQHAPLKLLLNQIEARFAPLADTSPLRAQLEQIAWLASHGHYPAAAALAREWIVSVRVVTEGGNVFPVNNTEREIAEQWLNDRDKKIPTEWQAVLEVWRNLTDLRNDLMHFGMRQSPKQPKTIQAQVEKLPQQLREAVQPLGIDMGYGTVVSAPIHSESQKEN